MKCQKCNKPVKETWKCCPYCESAIGKEKPDCTPCTGFQDDGKPCGFNLLSTSKFCPNCGTKNQREQTHDVSGARVIDSDYENESDCADGDVDYQELIDLLKEELTDEQTHDASGARAIDLDNEDGSDCAEEIARSRTRSVMKCLHEVYAAPKKLKKKMTRNTFVNNILGKISECDTAIVKFGIIGRSGMGKSSFINLLLGDNVAKPGSTQALKHYKHPTNENLTISDMPGFGTLEFTKSKFLETIDLSKFDYFFIFFDTVFMEDDQRIAEELTERKIPFCLVRSKMDIYLGSEEAKKCPTDITAIIQLRKKLLDSKKKSRALMPAELFLITNRAEFDYTFDLYKLLHRICQTLCPGKSDFFMIHVTAFSPKAIEMKVNCFMGRTLLFKKIRRFKNFFFFGSSYEYMKREIERCYQALELNNVRIKEVPDLKHVLSLGRELPCKDDQCWKDISYLDANYELLKEDALKVYNFFHPK